MTSQEQHPATPSEEEVACRMLDVFAKRGVRVLKIEQLRADMSQDPQFCIAAFEHGAKYAIQQGWLGFIGSSDVRLLEPGAQQIRSFASQKI